MDNLILLIIALLNIFIWLVGVNYLTDKLVDKFMSKKENDNFDIHYLNYVSEVLPGETYADNIVGATLCPNCQYYFRQDDTYDDELCRECVAANG